MSAVLTLSVCSVFGAANKKESVAQVTTTVSLTEDVDYSVTSATPFGENGIVNIVNTEHAALILENVKPSLAIPLLASHVQINGVAAVNDRNCQVRIYNRGTIVFPYDRNYKPLTIYSEPNFGGTSVNDYNLGNSGGFMQTLTEAQLNNKVRSFKLKRGYMVTFANRPSGRGYSRCFIAADEDLEIASLPAIIDRSISSYRIFKWQYASKSGIANTTGYDITQNLNVTSCYSFGPGENRLPDAECVPHHIYEDWPTPSAIGKLEYSCHMKTNNEPGNSDDPSPQSVATVLANWENLMATGMRLCSPSSHDGSLNHLREFMDSIDARGWRCDIVDLHCYWNEWNLYNSIKGWVDKYHRPIWVSEWVWGSSWNNEGIFKEASSRNNPTAADLQRNKEVVAGVLNAWNSYDYVERYFYWNSEVNCSKVVYDDGYITPTGTYYSQMNTGVGYNGKYEFIPTVPPQGSVSDFAVAFDKDTHTATLSWYDPNGDMSYGVYVERSPGRGMSFSQIAEIERKEQAGKYTFVDTEAVNGYLYRIHVIDANKKDQYTKDVMAASDEVSAGDAVNMNGEMKYLGGNILVNGDFKLGLAGFTSGTGAALDSAYFFVSPVGGKDNGIFLQAMGDGSANTAQAVYTSHEIESNKDYYFCGSLKNTSGYGYLIGLTKEGSSSMTTGAQIYNSSDVWNTLYKTFNSGDNTTAHLVLRKMNGQAQIANLYFAQLFDTPEEAYADGIEKMRQKARFLQQVNTTKPSLNTESEELLSAITGNNLEDLIAAERIVGQSVKAYLTLPVLDSLIYVTSELVQFGLYGHETLEAILEQALQANTAQAVISSAETLKETLNDYAPFTALSSNPIKNYDFSGTASWKKIGTYSGGEQTSKTVNSVSCWYAWWSDISSSEGLGKTMGISQDITVADHGLYALRCQASTQHYCLSDQHAFLVQGSDTLVSPSLTFDRLDIDNATNATRWEKLMTLPFYVEDNSKLTVGFIGSKNGAKDNAYRPFGDLTSTGDRREGWWCATNFQLCFVPLYRTTTMPDQWNVICLPYAIRASEDVRLYDIAGISDDYTKLCLTEVSEVKAGTPCIYRTSKANIQFLEYGKKASLISAGSCGLLGNLKEKGYAMDGDYVLTDGEWHKVGENDFIELPYYSALLPELTDEVPMIADWDGPSMPISGVTEAEKQVIAEGISRPKAVIVQRPGGIYTLDGRNVTTQHLTPGIYVKVNRGKATKVIIR